MNTCKFCGNPIETGKFCDSSCRQRYDYHYRAKDKDIMKLRQMFLIIEISQAKLKNVIYNTKRVIMLDAEPDNRSWIERKYGNNGC